jgi:hypothetical protein
MSAILDVRRLSTTQLARAVRVLIDKADHAADKAEQFYKAAGAHLRTLKEGRASVNGKGFGTWEEFVKERCGIASRRADELIMIADGRTTLEKVRASKAESMRRLRARQQSEPRGSGRSLTVVEEPDELASDDEDETTEAAEEKEPLTQHQLRRLFLSQAGLACQAALQPYVKELRPHREIASAAQQVADVWTELAANVSRKPEPDVEDDDAIDLPCLVADTEYPKSCAAALALAEAILEECRTDLEMYDFWHGDREILMGKIWRHDGTIEARKKERRQNDRQKRREAAE